MVKELPGPQASVQGDEPIELVRCWISNGVLQASLRLGLWKEIGPHEEVVQWSNVISDLIMLIASGVSQDCQLDPKVTGRQIMDAISRELTGPRSMPSDGKFVD